MFISIGISATKMGVFSCSSCNKPIKTILHRCWFEDPLTCKVYDPGETTWAARWRDALRWRSEDSLFESDSGCPIGEDWLSWIPWENGHYSRWVSI